MELPEPLPEVLKLALAAGIGVVGKSLYDSSVKRRRRRELRALFLAEAGALREAAREAKEFGRTGRFEPVVSHLKRVLSCYDQPDFIVLAGGDTWTRAQLLKRRERFKEILQRLEGSKPHQDDLVLESIYDDYLLPSIEKTGRWRRPLAGTRYTKHLGDGWTEIRWYQWRRRWKVMQEVKKHRRLAGPET
jgi:hypothetical protein